MVLEASEKASRFTTPLRPLFHSLKVTIPNQPFPALLPGSGSHRLDRLPAQAFHFKLLLFPRHIGRAGAGDGHSLQGWTGCRWFQPGTSTPETSNKIPLFCLPESTSTLAKLRFKDAQQNVPFPPFWRLVVIPSWSFLLTASPPCYLNWILIAPN